MSNYQYPPPQYGNQSNQQQYGNPPPQYGNQSNQQFTGSAPQYGTNPPQYGGQGMNQSQYGNQQQFTGSGHPPPRPTNPAPQYGNQQFTSSTPQYGTQRGNAPPQYGNQQQFTGSAPQYGSNQGTNPPQYGSNQGTNPPQYGNPPQRTSNPPQYESNQGSNPPHNPPQRTSNQSQGGNPPQYESNQGINMEVIKEITHHNMEVIKEQIHRNMGNPPQYGNPPQRTSNPPAREVIHRNMEVIKEQILLKEHLIKAREVYGNPPQRTSNPPQYESNQGSNPPQYGNPPQRTSNPPQYGSNQGSNPPQYGDPPQRTSNPNSPQGNTLSGSQGVPPPRPSMPAPEHTRSDRLSDPHIEVISETESDYGQNDSFSGEYYDDDEIQMIHNDEIVYDENYTEELSESDEHEFYDGEDSYEAQDRKDVEMNEYNGHQFVPVKFSKPTWCTSCKEFLWGITKKQGYECLVCKATVHGHCQEQIGACVGSAYGSIGKGRQINDMSWVAEKSGWLKKKTKKGWNKRWAVLEGTLLYYFTAPDKERHSGVVDITALSSIDLYKDDQILLQLESGKLARVYNFRCTDDRDREEWYDILIRTRDEAHTRNASLSSGKIVGYVLKCSGKKLERKEAGGIGLSNPFIAIYPFTGDHYKGFRGEEKLICRSGVIMGSVNPSWEPFNLYLDLTKGMETQLSVECWNYRHHGGHDLIGQFVATMQELIDPGQQWKFVNPVKKTPFYKHSGHFAVTSAVPVDPGIPRPFAAPKIRVKFRAESLSADGQFTINPFIIIKAVPPKVKENEVMHNNLLRPIAKSVTIKKQSSCTWPSVEIPVDLCGWRGELLIEVYNWRTSRKHEMIGSTTTTFFSLTMSNPRFPLVNEKHKGNIGYQNSGTLFVVGCTPDFSEPPPETKRIRFTCSGRKIEKKMSHDGSSDPYFIIRGIPHPQVSQPYNPRISSALANFDVTNRPMTPLYKSNICYGSGSKANWNSFELDVLDVGGFDTPLRIEVYDYERSGTHNFIGAFECSLRELTLPNSSFRIAHPKKTYTAITPNSGVFYVNHWEPIPEVEIVSPIGFEIELRIEKIERKDLMGLANSDPFISFIAKPYTSNNPYRVHKTEVALNSRSADFKPFTLYMDQCGGWDEIIEVECWDMDRKQRADFIGKFKTTLRELSYYKTSPKFNFINPKKKKKIGYRHSGYCYVVGFNPIPPPQAYEPVTRKYDEVEFTVVSGPQATNIMTQSGQQPMMNQGPPGQPGQPMMRQGPPPGQPMMRQGPPGQPGQPMMRQGPPPGQPMRQGPPGQPGQPMMRQGPPPGQPMMRQGPPPGQPMMRQGPPPGQPMRQGNPIMTQPGQPMMRQGPPPGQPQGNLPGMPSHLMRSHQGYQQPPAI
eukprot:TRINITY_DN2211_c0_g1_i10.p1 TRINITY_DN2211_c0_g1~~TRINITY_DN2211_c0_g1_i10.p1  ORF type:complete len:1371 (+),score=313.30 TRINITY_DN2211_c0_g1_i10:80-4192(+)